MEDEEERAEAFLKETLVHFDTLDEGMEAYARIHPTSAELLALSIRSLPITEKQIQASIERLEQRQRPPYVNDARSRTRWAVRRLGDHYIVILSQYCHPRAILPQDFYIGASEYARQESLQGDAVFGAFLHSHARLKRALAGRANWKRD